MERAKAGHFALYALLIAIPVLGILLTWLRGDALSFFSLFTVPAPFQPDRDTARTVQELHGLCANAILFLTGIHAMAAFWHHFIRKDDVLDGCCPQVGKRIYVLVGTFAAKVMSRFSLRL
jgi:cytochrome b561